MSFSGDIKEADFDFQLPAKVAKEWERYDERMGIPLKSSYDDVVLSYRDMQLIFDPVIDQILGLVGNQLRQVGVGGVQVLAVVGGFAASGYLMQRMKDAFRSHVPQIISLPTPGALSARAPWPWLLIPAPSGPAFARKRMAFLPWSPSSKASTPPIRRVLRRRSEVHQQVSLRSSISNPTPLLILMWAIPSAILTYQKLSFCHKASFYKASFW